MAISSKFQGDASKFHFGTGNAAIVSGSVDKSYTVNIDIVDGTGELTDIAYGGEEHKISVTKYGDTVDTLGESITFGGTSGYVTKSTVLKSNEDVSTVQSEALGAPNLSSGGGGA